MKSENKMELKIGSRITCQTNNHFICEVIDTIRQGDENWSRKLGNWQMPEPERGSQPVCYICGSWFWASKNNGVLHIENEGWLSNNGTVQYIEEVPLVPLMKLEPKPLKFVDKILEMLGI